MMAPFNSLITRLHPKIQDYFTAGIGFGATLLCTDTPLANIVLINFFFFLHPEMQKNHERGVVVEFLFEKLGKSLLPFSFIFPSGYLKKAKTSDFT